MKFKLVFLFLFLGIIVSAQNGQKSIKNTFDLLKKQDHVSYFDVSKEMFQMLSETENMSSELKEYLSKINELKMVESTRRVDQEYVNIYDEFLTNADLKGFIRLMTSESQHEKITYFRKKNDDKTNEFLLVSSNTAIYVAGKIDLKSIAEFESVLKVAGNAMGL